MTVKELIKFLVEENPDDAMILVSISESTVSDIERDGEFSMILDRNMFDLRHDHKVVTIEI